MSSSSAPPTSTPYRKPRGKHPQEKERAQVQKDNILDNMSTPKPKTKHRSHHHRAHEPNAVQDAQLSPSTPPSAAALASGPSAEAVTSPTQSKRKQTRGRKKQNGPGQEIQTAHIPNIAERTNPAVDRPEPVSTPSKQAPQIYAGPTFHASPAPSSLPIPKFFTKSLATTTKAPEAAAAPSDDDSSQDSSSGKGDESPSLRNALPTTNPHAREPSPLDIFFKADREEKARRSQSIPQVATFITDRAKSASPSIQSFREGEARQHARRQTESTSYAESSNIEDTRAKTEALKQLLFMPTAQRSSPNVNSSYTPPSQGVDRRANGMRSSSGTSTPSRLFPTSVDAAYGASSLQDSPSVRQPFERPALSQRQLPYHVRQELLNKLPLDQGEAPPQSRYVTPLRP